MLLSQQIYINAHKIDLWPSPSNYNKLSTRSHEWRHTDKMGKQADRHGFRLEKVTHLHTHIHSHIHTARQTLIIHNLNSVSPKLPGLRTVTEKETETEAEACVWSLSPFP